MKKSLITFLASTATVLTFALLGGTATVSADSTNSGAQNSVNLSSEVAIPVEQTSFNDPQQQNTHATDYEFMNFESSLGDSKKNNGYIMYHRNINGLRYAFFANGDSFYDPK